jgi:hypothetical protein
MEIPPLPDTTILMVEVGSTAHGTGMPGGEDHDQLAVVVETPEQVLGLDPHGFDTKYAMHCSRLGFQCLELLTTGALQLPIQGEPADWLRAVRRGDVAFADWWERSLKLDADLERLGDDGSIRPRPDSARINTSTIDAHQRVRSRATSPR